MFLPSVSGRVAFLPTFSRPPDAHVAACGYWEEPAELAGGGEPKRAVHDVNPDLASRGSSAAAARREPFTPHPPCAATEHALGTPLWTKPILAGRR